mmetsp:Transcript_42143/g.35399  ORF Transcript_42143/g.35399 Transcript_42143/m.35399 type:complete len:83 (+) Transcript_42143:328-576(+)
MHLQHGDLHVLTFDSTGVPCEENKASARGKINDDGLHYIVQPAVACCTHLPNIVKRNVTASVCLLEQYGALLLGCDPLEIER